MSSLSPTTAMQHTGFPSAAYSAVPNPSHPGQLQSGDGRIMEALDLSGLMQRSSSDEELMLRLQLQNALREKQIAFKLLEDAYNKIHAYKFIVLRQSEQRDKADKELTKIYKKLNRVTIEFDACRREKECMLQCRQATAPSVSLVGKIGNGLVPNDGN